jgi:hypothetical protein
VKRARRWRDIQWLSNWHGHMDGWAGSARYGPPAGYGRIGERLYERARVRAAARRKLFDTATADRDHESEDASAEEIFHTIERQYRPGAWLAFVATLDEA